jgi:hypothetical protein
MGRLEHTEESAAAAMEAVASNEEGTPTPETEVKEEETPKTEDSPISDEDPGEPKADTEEVTDEDKTEDSEEKEEKEEKEEEDKTPKEEFSADFDGWTNEFLQDGALSDETRADVIAKVFHEGVPDEMKAQFVAAYEAGMVSIQTVAVQEAYNLVGGQDDYQQMISWAQSTLSEEEIVAYDADALGEDIVKRDSVIKGLHARFQQATGSDSDFEPNLAHSGGRSQGEPIIGSRQELAKIQSTEEYQKDPAVRAKVARQLKQSIATGKYLG